MAKVEILRALVKQRLAAAAEEIFVLFERTMAEFQQELYLSNGENLPQRHLLDADVHLPAADLQQMLADKEELHPKQNDQIPNLDQEATAWPQQDWSLYLEPKDSAPAHIKVEQEEADVTRFQFPGIPVKSENDEAETDNSHFWKETSEQELGLKTTTTCEVSVSDVALETAKKSFASGSIFHSELESCYRTETLYSCSVCAAAFPSEENLELHMGLHQGVQQLDDRLCDQTLTGCEDFKEDFVHRSQTEGRGRRQEARSFAADGQIEPQTDETSDISEHETDEDWEETREAPSGLKSVRSNNVPVSVKRCNTGEKPFSCSECDTSFVHKKSLYRHMRIHMEDKTCRCLTCGQFFYTKGSLNEHMKSHKEVKPFSCSQCGTRFGHKKSLYRHIKAHSGEKLFSCSDCGKKFGRKSHLVRHAMIHTRRKTFH